MGAINSFRKRADAKAATIIGAVTVLFGLAAIGDSWYITSICWTAAGLYLASREPHNVRGLSGLKAKVIYLVLITVGVMFGPVA